MNKTTPREVVTRFREVSATPEAAAISAKLAKAKDRAIAGRILGLTAQERFLIQAEEPDADNLDNYLQWFDTLPIEKQLYAKRLPQAARINLKYTADRLKNK